LEQFSTVDDFLRKAEAAKTPKREAIADGLHDHLMDPGTVAVPPALHDVIESYVHRYGDEAYRQIGLYALGKWFAMHTKLVEEFLANDQIHEACACIMDASRISSAMHLLTDLGSFGGDDDWREMVEETMSQAILEDMEEMESGL
jgi:hypothetical protein